MCARVAVAVLVVLGWAAAPARAALPDAPCTGDPSALKRLDISVAGQSAYGMYALPRERPRGLVVFGHGYTFNVDAWRNHIVRAATQDGLVAVAMNYRGLTDLPRDATTYERSRGFPVKAGGEDLVAAAQQLDARCGGFDRRFLLGVSMGGNATGLAAAMGGKTASGRPIFDYWITIEAVYNFRETYLEARAVGANEPREDIEKEAGGPIEQRPDAYRERTVLDRAGDVARSGLKGIVMVHGYNDGLVPYNQAQEFVRAIRREGTPTDFYTATRKGPGDQPDDARLPGGPADGPGHASEWARHVVIDTGMDRLSALARRDEPPPCNRDFTVDGTATPPASPDPSKPASGCPDKPAFAGSPARAPAPASGGGGGSGGSGSGSGGGGGPAAACPDVARPPALTFIARRSARGRLAARGRATSRDCGAGGGVKRVRIAVSRIERGGRCRSVSRPARARLSRPRSCTRRRIFLRPAGVRSFRLSLKGLPAGRYRLTAVATGRDARSSSTRTVRVP